MNKNGSPAPIFDTENSTYFMVTIPVHPKFDDQVSNQAVSGVKELKFNNIEDDIEYCNQASNQASDRLNDQVSDQAKVCVNDFIHSKVKEILDFTSVFKT